MAYRLLIQQQTFDGTTYTNVGNVVDTIDNYGVACQEFPFKVLPETKELPKRDWYDEDGEDVYVPSDGMKFKAYDLEVKFIYSDIHAPSRASGITKEKYMRDKIGAFIEFICGRNTSGKPFLKIYDEYTKTGRRGVYVLSVDNELYFYNDVSIDAIAEFKVKFRVTDPVYEVSMTTSNNTITLT